MFNWALPDREYMKVARKSRNQVLILIHLKRIWWDASSFPSSAMFAVYFMEWFIPNSAFRIKRLIFGILLYLQCLLFQNPMHPASVSEAHQSFLPCRSSLGAGVSSQGFLRWELVLGSMPSLKSDYLPWGKTLHHDYSSPQLLLCSGTVLPLCH